MIGASSQRSLAHPDSKWRASSQLGLDHRMESIDRPLLHDGELELWQTYRIAAVLGIDSFCKDK